MIPTGKYGSFENTDIMRRQIGPLSKNQCFLVEDDYLDRANIDIIRGRVNEINIEDRTIKVKGMRKPIKFEKLLVAWPTTKKLFGESPCVMDQRLGLCRASLHIKVHSPDSHVGGHRTVALLRPTIQVCVRGARDQGF